MGAQVSAQPSHNLGMETPEPKAPVVIVQSSAQVWSAAVQNIVISLCITVGWLADKIGNEVAVGALLGIAGIDFLGRVRKFSGTPAAALALGATGVFK